MIVQQGSPYSPPPPPCPNLSPIEEEEEEEILPLGPPPQLQLDFLHAKRLSFSEELVKYSFVPASPVACAVHRCIGSELKRTHEDLDNNVYGSSSAEVGYGGEVQSPWKRQKATSSMPNAVRMPQSKHDDLKQAGELGMEARNRESWAPMVDDLADFFAANQISPGKMEIEEEEKRPSRRRADKGVTVRAVRKQQSKAHLRGGASSLLEVPDERGEADTLRSEISSIASWNGSKVAKGEDERADNNRRLRDSQLAFPIPPQTPPRAPAPRTPSPVFTLYASPRTPSPKDERRIRNPGRKGSPYSLFPPSPDTVGASSGIYDQNRPDREREQRSLGSPFQTPKRDRRPTHHTQDSPISDLWENGNQVSHLNRAYNALPTGVPAERTVGGSEAFPGFRVWVKSPEFSATEVSWFGLGEENKQPQSLRQNRPTRAAHLNRFSGGAGEPVKGCSPHALDIERSAPRHAHVGPYDDVERGPPVLPDPETATIRRVSIWDGPDLNDAATDYHESQSVVAERMDHRGRVQGPLVGDHEMEMARKIEREIKQYLTQAMREHQEALEIIHNSDLDAIRKMQQIQFREDALIFKYRQKAMELGYGKVSDVPLNIDGCALTLEQSVDESGNSPRTGRELLQEILLLVKPQEEQAPVQPALTALTPAPAPQSPASRPSSPLVTVGKKIGRVLRYALAIPDDPDLKSYSRRKPPVTVELPTGGLFAGGIAGRVSAGNQLQSTSRPGSRTSWRKKGKRNESGERPIERLNSAPAGLTSGEGSRPPPQQAIGYKSELSGSTLGNRSRSSGLRPWRYWGRGDAQSIGKSTTNTVWPNQSDIYAESE